MRLAGVSISGYSQGPSGPLRFKLFSGFSFEVAAQSNHQVVKHLVGAALGVWREIVGQIRHSAGAKDAAFIFAHNPRGHARSGVLAIEKVTACGQCQNDNQPCAGGKPAFFVFQSLILSNSPSSNHAPDARFGARVWFGGVVASFLVSAVYFDRVTRAALQKRVKPSLLDLGRVAGFLARGPFFWRGVGGA